MRALLLAVALLAGCFLLPAQADAFHFGRGRIVIRNGVAVRTQGLGLRRQFLGFAGPVFVNRGFNNVGFVNQDLLLAAELARQQQLANLLNAQVFQLRQPFLISNQFGTGIQSFGTGIQSFGGFGGVNVVAPGVRVNVGSRCGGFFGF